MFQDAYEIYLSFSKNANLVDAKTDRVLKTSFKDLILHPDYGLCIYIVRMCGERYICLRPDNANISCIFDALAEKAKQEDASCIDVPELKNLMELMDTEWDKKVLCYVLSSVRCYSEIKELGFDVHNVKQLRAEMKSFLGQMGGIEEEARRNVKGNLKQAYNACQDILTKKRRLVAAKKHLWTTEQIEDKEEEVEDIESCAASYKKVLDDENEASLERRVKYEKTKLITTKRQAN